MRTETVMGVDGCRGGWVGLVLGRRGSRFEALEAVGGPTVASVVAGAQPVSVVAVDIPIGLPVDRPRAADLAVQGRLGRRRASVFATPVREALTAATLAEANAISRALTGVGVSAQAYALRGRILEVDSWARVAAARGLDVREAHPEVSFAVMSGGPMPGSKRTWNGAHDRIAALAAGGIRLPEDLGPAGAASAIDDVLDAAAAAWTAARVVAGEAFSFPSPPEHLGGWPAAVWA